MLGLARSEIDLLESLQFALGPSGLSSKGRRRKAVPLPLPQRCCVGVTSKLTATVEPDGSRRWRLQIAKAERRIAEPGSRTGTTGGLPVVVQ